jgi:hypothetical protein
VDEPEQHDGNEDHTSGHTDRKSDEKLDPEYRVHPLQTENKGVLPA